MADASRTTPHASSIHGDFDGLPSAPEKKLSPRSVFSWLFSVVCRKPFMSAIVIYMALTGSIAGAIIRLYEQFGWFATEKIPYGQSGVGFSLV